MIDLISIPFGPRRKCARCGDPLWHGDLAAVDDRQPDLVFCPDTSPRGCAARAWGEIEEQILAELEADDGC